jgi:ABC-type amino acid transport substrate-binding protein
MLENARPLLTWYVDLCVHHPLLAVGAGIVVLVVLGSGIAKTVTETVTHVRRVWHLRGRLSRFQRRSLLAAVGLIVTVVVATPTAVRRAVASKPVITSPRGRTLDQRPVVRWTYVEGGVDTRYRLAITNRDTGVHKQQCTEQSVLPLTMSGRLSLKVEAFKGPGCDSIHVEAESEDVPLELFQDSVERIRYLKTLAYGVHHDASDGMFCYERDGKYDGVDRELIELIGDELRRQYNLPELKLIPYEYSWDAIFEAPKTHQIDLAIASISITDERQARFNVRFSNPYWRSELALIVPRHQGDIRPFMTYTLDNLAGKRIGFHQKTTAADIAPKLATALHNASPKFTPAEDNEQLFALLANGEVDGVLYDLDRSWSIAPIQSQWIPARLDLAAIGYSPEKYGIMFESLNSRLKTDVDRALASIGPGRIKSLIEKHIHALPGMSTNAVN